MEWKIKDCGKPYLVRLTNESFKDFNQHWKGAPLFIFTEPTVWEIYEAAWADFFSKQKREVFVHQIESGESAKQLETVQSAWHFLNTNHASRKSQILAFGGGALTDTTGFIASTYLRGLPLTLIPTTLLGQVDSCLGSKTAINWKNIKNKIGAFYSPSSVYCNINFLDSLSPKSWQSGFAEIIKMAALQDEPTFSMLESEGWQELSQNDDKLFSIIKKSMEGKIDIISKDPWDDSGIRVLLNFGHTLGHAIESAGNFQSYTHGQAIGLGMLLESRLATLWGHLPENELTRLEKILAAFELPTSLPDKINWEHFFLEDKKRFSQNISFVLLERIGKSFSTTLPIEKLLKDMEKIL